jgi:hypothetical protein
LRSLLLNQLWKSLDASGGQRKIYHVLYVSLCSIDANQAIIQDDFNPEDIPFRTLPTMSEAVLKTMLPDKEGKVHSANLHKGILLL